SLELPELEQSARWQTLTPFVPPRFWHRKKGGQIRGGQTPELQLIRCLKKNQGPFDCAVSRLNSSGKVDWDVCKVHLPPGTRDKHAEPESRVGLRLQVEFGQAVALPLPAFSHSCHFGLGQFVGDPSQRGE